MPLRDTSAETEKYAHVTFFFNGGVEKQYDNEERHMIPSPKVATYDKQPEMSVQSVADKVAEVVKSHEYDFVMCNFAPPDMAGFFPHPRLGLFFLISGIGGAYWRVRGCGQGDRRDRQSGEDGV